MGKKNDSKQSNNYSSINGISLLGSYINMIKPGNEGEVANLVNGVYLSGRTVKYDVVRIVKNRAKKIRRNMQITTRKSK